MTRALSCWMCVVLVALTVAGPTALAADDAAVAKRGQQTINKAVAFLRKTQAADGSWSAQSGPAITALVLTGLLDQPNIDANDPTARKAIEYLLRKQRNDGGIHDGILGNYNTSISISALSRIVPDPHKPPSDPTALQKRVAAAMLKAERYVRKLQYQSGVDEQGRPITENHPHFGGVGYGKHGRPDGSNTQMFVQALIDMNIDCKDPAVLRAVGFMNQLQGSSTNKRFGKQIQPDGGAIYAPSINKDHIGIPQSQASQDMIDEGKAGRPVSNLRTYGSMTYAMFKTYIHAQLEPGDKRVTDAVKWLQRNYTVSHNPGMPEERKMQGHYYYLVTMARALDAWHSLRDRHLTDAAGKRIRWDHDMVNLFAKMQRADGSFINEADRWLEGDPNLVTGYAVIAMTQAMRQLQ